MMVPVSLGGDREKMSYDKNRFTNVDKSPSP